MTCEPTHRTRILLVALVAVLVALFIPATGHAAERDRLASAGVLERGAGYGSAGGSHAVRILQARLGRSGDRPGPIDGLYGPLTQGAVQRFQQRHGLAVDGIVGRVTWINIDEADQSEPVLRLGSSGLPVRRLQSRMTAVGFDTGGVDGRFSPKTEVAVKDLQQRSHLAVDGVVGPQTWGVVDALENEGGAS